MKNLTLETFQAITKKNIQLISAFTEINELPFIIKSCRLRPYPYFYQNKKKRFDLYKSWFDEYKTLFKIVKNKRIELHYNYLPLSLNFNSDIYSGLSMKNIAKISKLVFVYVGRDEFKNEISIVSFLGIDDYFRTYLLDVDEWIKVSPLIIGISNLRYIANNLDIKHFVKVPKQKNIPVPCRKGEAWLSYNLPSKQFLQKLKERHSVVSDIFAS